MAPLVSGRNGHHRVVSVTALILAGLSNSVLQSQELGQVTRRRVHRSRVPPNHLYDLSLRRKLMRARGVRVAETDRDPLPTRGAPPRVARVQRQLACARHGPP